jgi:lipopolysaccharide transport system permease protein
MSDSGSAPVASQVVTRIGGQRSVWAALQLREMWSYRDLFLTFGQRDVKLRYRQTALGVSWVLLQPLIAAAIFAFVFGRVARLPSDGHPYFLFAFAGLMGWNAFNTTLTRTSTSLLANSQLVSKVYFPRLILPASTLMATGIDFIITSGVMGGMLVVTGTPLTLHVLLLPLWLALLLMLASGMGLVLGGTSVRFRDVAILTPVAAQMLLYISPVAYPVSSVPQKYHALYSMNPLTGLLEGFRWSLLGNGHLAPVAFITAVVGPLLALAGGVLYFRRIERGFADVI